jgi:hypothetical protein
MSGSSCWHGRVQSPGACELLEQFGSAADTDFRDGHHPLPGTSSYEAFTEDHFVQFRTCGVYEVIRTIGRRLNSVAEEGDLYLPGGI